MSAYKPDEFLMIEPAGQAEVLVPHAALRFADMGLNDTAYVKRAVVEGQRVWAIHAADGTPLTTLATRDTAFAAVRQHALEPVSVH